MVLAPVVLLAFLVFASIFIFCFSFGLLLFTEVLAIVGEVFGTSKCERVGKGDLDHLESREYDVIARQGITVLLLWLFFAMRC
ncbi:hypothetical protein I7I53_07521 [Histoplasma capsulatum var. duboisii H88]|uniref:Uncharacterized protein n=1 Tax=Ajellomyces capsulatus (strain H88) TaxID=544711 RepID=A0A8A1LH97_AJEC8|nr:hypothetical protein I7I53_07521 [Histoplasma capsulatum var. duboisii H88]